MAHFEVWMLRFLAAVPSLFMACGLYEQIWHPKPNPLEPDAGSPLWFTFCKLSKVDELIGSGTLVCPNVILTALHNLENVPSGFNARFYGGRNVSLRQAAIVRGLNGRDYGLIVLHNVSAGINSVFFQLSVVDSDEGIFYITGYPNDPSYNGELAVSSGTISLDDGQTFTYHIDTSSGQSGSPIYHKRDAFGQESHHIVGVHLEARIALGFASSNTGLRFTEDDIAFILDHCIWA